MNGHHVPTSPDATAAADVRKIGQACLAGLKQAGEDLKEVKERVNVAEQSSAEKLGELDLRVSAVESSQQSLEALFHENKALRQSIEYLTNSVNPARQAKIEERQQETDSRIQQLLEQISAITTSASSSHARGTQSADFSSGQAFEHSAIAEAVQASPSPDRSSTALEQPKPPADPPIQPSTYNKETVERVLARQSEHAGVLEECLHHLENSAAHRLEKTRHGNDMNGLLLPTIDCKVTSKASASVSPLKFALFCSLDTTR
jgi:archaellum component FlaC